MGNFFIGLSIIPLAVVVWMGAVVVVSTVSEYWHTRGYGIERRKDYHLHLRAAAAYAASPIRWRIRIPGWYVVVYKPIYVKAPDEVRDRAAQIYDYLVDAKSEEIYGWNPEEKS